LLRFSTLIATTVVASFAIGLIACFHFGSFTHYGFIANFIGVLVTALWIIPMGCWSFYCLAAGVSIITMVTGEVASWPGAVTLHPKLPMSAFLISMFGGLWLSPMRGRWLWLGIASVLRGLFAIPPDTATGYTNY
jgi:competence protein ComEC